MTKTLTILFVVACTPLFAYALTVQNTVSSQTTGASDASADVRTVMHGNPSGSVKVDIETNSDGVTHHESFTKDTGGSGIDIEIGTSSRSRDGSAEGRAHIVIGASSSRERPPRSLRFFTATSSEMLDISLFGHATGTRASSRLENFLKRLFNFFHRL